MFTVIWHTVLHLQRDRHEHHIFCGVRHVVQDAGASSALDYPTLTLTGTQSLAEVLSVEILKVVDVVLLHRVLY
jgi:succinate dehydrogenase/fumarate reductase cytochrome b subunit